ncbi:Avirulence (Avh) protein [Phytophthora megakarya]|uniref:Avirulence (Avh) protein n=1 Tax=Phytophthora megakarya TaxID=4795 RepID=A0A225V7T5_9STRA|nr:Avirulence (Avh) protein [Phytophthora megakarya]
MMETKNRKFQRISWRSNYKTVKSSLRIMRFHYAVVLATLLCVGVLQSFLGAPGRFDSVYAASVDESNAPSKPLLRPNDAVDDEERGGVSTFAIEKVANTISNPASHRWFSNGETMNENFMKQYATNLKGMLKENKSPTEVFKRFELDKAGDTVLTNPLFGPWLKYVQYFNRENPSNKFCLIAALPHAFNKPSNWNKMLALAMKDPRTVKYANIVNAERFKVWLNHEKTPRYTFSYLVAPYTKIEDNLLASQAFKIWTKYLNDFNKMYPDRSTNMIDAFRIYYKDIEMARIVAVGKSNVKTEALATDLERLLLKTWLRELKSPNDVSKIMNVETSSPMMQIYRKRYDWAHTEAGDKLFDSPRKWKEYLNYYYKVKNPATDEATISILVNRYGDEALAKMVAHSGDSRSLSNLRDALIKNWLDKQKTPAEISKLLHLDNAGEKLLETPEMKLWKLFKWHAKNQKKNAPK